MNNRDEETALQEKVVPRVLNVIKEKIKFMKGDIEQVYNFFIIYFSTYHEN